MRLLHAVAFSKELQWLAQPKVITLKTQPMQLTHAENACRNVAVGYINKIFF
jgi:hypothetical protein